MTEALVVSNITLWIVVLALLLAVLALARQVGILYERVAPMGALMLDHGPQGRRHVTGVQSRIAGRW
jgi:hypothetical protein